MPKAKPLILDTSVAAKWFIQEPDAYSAVSLLEEVVEGNWQLIAPDLIRLELTHVFWKRKEAGYSARQLHLAFKELTSLGLQEVPWGSLQSRAIETAYRLNITVYDACYVALAEEFKAALATFDRDLMKRVRRQIAIPMYPFLNG